MNLGHVAVVVVCLLAAAPQADTARIVGIVEVPRRFVDVEMPDGSLERRDSGRRVVLRRRPSADSPVVVTISSLKALRTVEFSYDQDGRVRCIGSFSVS